MSKLEKILLGVNFLLYGFLAIFSYAYVDLNLTLSQIPLALKFVDLMQQLGYYHRPQATFIYIVFIIAAFSFFVLNLFLFHKSKISLKYLKFATIINTMILIFSYPFLSSDIFNYLFDAKIITHYHVSPYNHRPLDFPSDDWLRFMRWIHRYSPYGPVWLGLSLIPSILGFGKFLVTFFTFKIFIAAFHLINSEIIFKTLKKINPQHAVFGMAFYAVNPLFLIEGVANAHNDIVFTSFLILPIYFSFAKKKEIWSYTVILIGILIKYISILNLPWFVLKTRFKKPESFKAFVILNMLTLGLFTIIYSSVRITVPFVSSGATQVQFQPWYLFWTLPFIALIPEKGFILIATVLAIGSMFRYLPFIYFGVWSQSGTVGYMQFVTIAPFVVSILMIATLKFKKK